MVKFDEWGLPTKGSRPHDPWAAPDGTIWVVRPEHNLSRSVQAHGESAGLTGGPTVTLTDEYVGDRFDVRDDGNGDA